MPGVYSATLDVVIDGKRLPDDVADLMEYAHVDGHRLLPDTFVLRFRDPDRLVVRKSNVRIGSDVKLEAVAPGQSEPLMRGEVTALEADFDGTGTYTTIRGYDKAHRLMRGSVSATYLQATYSDIARKVAARAGLAVGKIDATTTVHPFVEQDNVSDWVFLSGLAGEVGYDLTVEDGRLSFRKPPVAAGAPSPSGTPASEAMLLRFGHDLLSCRTSVSAAGQVPRVEVRGWDPAAQRAILSTAPVRSGSAVLGVEPGRVANGFGARPLVVSDVPYRTKAATDAAAAALADRVAGGFAEFDGVVHGNPRLRAGSAVAIDNLGAPFDGKYVLTAVRHSFDPDNGYTTSFTVSGQHDRSLPALAGATGRGSVRRRPGVAVAVVTDVKDPDNAGRVKLMLPWLADNHVTDWARVLQPGAGKNRGAMVLPEVNDEVLVAFEHGDPATPYVLGGLYSARNQAMRGRSAEVDAGTGQIVRRAFVTRTGHALEFLESTRQKGIWLKTGDGKLEVSMDGSVPHLLLRSDGTVEVKAARGVTIDAGNGDVSIRGQRIALAAKSGVTVDAGSGAADVKGARVSVRGAGAVEVGGARVAVKADAAGELSAGAVLTVRGTLVRIN